MNSLSSKCIRLVFVVVIAFCSSSFAFQVKVSDAPTNDLSLTLAALKSAKKTLLFNSYEFSSPQITAAIIDRINAGVSVRFLQEGQPVGGMSKAGKKAEQELVDAMNAVSDSHYFLMSSKLEKAKRRYRFDHAKYAVIDGAQLLIGSENYTDTGHPPAGKLGNRGWEVFIEDADVAAQYSKIFATDTDTSFGDVEEMTGNRKPNFQAYSVDFITQCMDAMKPALEVIENIEAIPSLVADNIGRVTSPDSSLKGLLALINGAKKSINIELMTFAKTWGSPTSQSPLFNAVVAAAHRGVVVRALLNDETVFFNGGGPQDAVESSKLYNVETIKALNEMAKDEGLDVEGRICDVKQMGVDYIHNKGVLVDGDQTLVSSINWNSNSVLNNREAAVVVTGSDINAHYTELFDKDWKASE